jgi:hypothetical protein
MWRPPPRDAVRNRRGPRPRWRCRLGCHSLLKALAERKMNTNGYDYVVVSESLSETLSIWQSGKFVFKTLT